MTLSPLKFFILSIFFLLQQPFFATANDCWSAVKEQAIERDKSLEKDYLKITKGASGLLAEKRSLFLIGREDGPALVLLHGFPASPEQLGDFAKILNGKYGFTVYAPVLTGFGGAAKVGNEVLLEDWRKDVEEAVTLVHNCANKIGLVGYSMGGGIAIDAAFYLYNLPITNLFLITPLVKTKSNFGIKTADFLQSIGLGSFGPISTRLVKQVTRIINYIESYKNGEAVNKIPTLLVTTDNDSVIDSEAAKNFTFAKMNIVSNLVFSKDMSVTHNSILNRDNPQLDDIAYRIDYLLNR